MKLARRRILYISFITTFAIVAPILIAYTSGYRFDFKKNRFQKTGILYIDSTPQGAQIFINGQYAADTPKRFTYLLPNEYDVEVRKEDYQSWHKKLDVKSNLTTFSRDIILFRNDSPTLLAEGPTEFFTMSPDRSKILYTTNGDKSIELRLRNVTNNTDLAIQSFETKEASDIEFISWSPGRTKALVREMLGTFNHYFIIDTETLRVQDMLDTSRLNFLKVSWGLNDDFILYGVRADVLYRIDLTNSTATIAVTDRVKDFRAGQTHLYYVTANSGPTLVRTTFSGNREDAETIKLPSTRFTIAPSPEGTILLLDERSEDMFLMDTKVFSDGDITKHMILQDKARAALWSDDATRLLYYTDAEIYIFEPATNHKYLVTRYGQSIKRATWYLNEPYIFSQIENELRAIETPDENNNVETRLATFSVLKEFAVDTSGKKMYILGELDSQKGIFELELQ